ncbi:hypothetical protein HPP92_024087 [Vanilla planifolia]|uniref:DUF3119 family protein n=1 Tax=Vanilla planifolia TaxID=51239 RepID=A0A835UB81_VANPL|nr:hypothetical protein HPP92_024087 [Vanilla planifolia]
MATLTLLSSRPLLTRRNGEALTFKGYGLRSSHVFHYSTGCVLKIVQSHGTCKISASMQLRRSNKKEIVIPDPDYRIPVILLGIAGGFLYQDNLLPAATIGLLGSLLLFQATRVRFVFDEEALEVRVGEKLEGSGENVFIGGENRWKYSTFVNWEFWWPNFPILVYFKETQTKPDGQVHFFPIIFNGKQLYDVMLERVGPSKTTLPK